MTCEEALEVANKIGYPVLMRPSYVLGGQNMIIAFNDEDIVEYMGIILEQNIDQPGPDRQIPDGDGAGGRRNL